jgi:tetratricopeptide (TPR) repeat protein
LHLLGVVSFQRGLYQQAAELIESAIGRSPGRADYFGNYGLALAALGKKEEAIAAYQRALSIKANYPEALNNLGLVLAASSRSGEAIDVYRRAIACSPGYFEAHNNLGSALSRAGKPELAVESFRKALELNPSFAESYSNLGTALIEQKKFDEAIEIFERAIQLPTRRAHSYFGLGNAWRAKEKYAEALAAYRESLSLEPDRAEVLTNLAEVLTLEGKKAEAIVYFEKAVELHPQLPELLCNLANAYGKNREYEKAMAISKKALAIRPDFVDALNNMASVMCVTGKAKEAIPVYEKALKLDPNSALVHWNYALALLILGHYSLGWVEYEWRWKVTMFELPPQALPDYLWTGAPLNGGRILLYTEQGFGDAIQFIRYVDLVVKRGGKVVIHCSPALVRLFANMEGVESASIGDESINILAHYPLLSLAKLFDTQLDTIPSKVPYLRADEESIRKWKELMPRDGKINVGLAWQGNIRPDPDRSVPPALLKELAGIGNVRFFSLQVDPSREPAPAELELIDHTKKLTDFAETAAMMAHLDLVIAIDTATAHLAGALGKKTWVMLKSAADWRWFLSGSHSPWYPTMKLFRQKRAGDWESVMEEIAGELRAFAKKD